MITRILIIIALCVLSYGLGRSHAKTKIITQEIEVIKYVKEQKALVHSRPNASRDTLLNLMHNNKL